MYDGTHNGISGDVRKVAQLLGVEETHVKDLISRQDHPLPLPPGTGPYDSSVFTREYLETLNAWVQREAAEKQPGESGGFNVSAVEQNLRRMTKEPPVYDFRIHFPPGYFLG